ncbi:hypothetical protein DS745_07365 [Anaerobacillus alkaliphilus]|uniref:S-layer homology domain-containing protein n=1 Tax=Anaerobacillus alkaliphilus TaxID=1548597 RepID=A0A4Q0VVV0_9BACI|nr:hypothetical protein [Anaerobacillus alkaliphilus]RXJ02202.1 hypothetical protein DS745_07365 [Anaerobacillus alkaliphilus]
MNTIKTLLITLLFIVVGWQIETEATPTNPVIQVEAGDDHHIAKMERLLIGDGQWIGCLTNLKLDGTFAPREHTTRSQMVKMLDQMLLLIEYGN